MRKSTFFLLMISLSLIVILLSACSQVVDMTFTKEGSWTVSNSFTYQESYGDLAGGLFDAFGLDIGGGDTINAASQTGMDMMMNLIRTPLREVGINLDYEQKNSDGNIITSIVMSSEKFESFNKLYSSMGVTPITITPEGYYNFQMDYAGMNEQLFSMLGLGEMTEYAQYLNYLTDYELRINTGKVITSNADEVKGGVAIWQNPTYVDITFMPKGMGGSFNFLYILIPLLVIGLIVGIVFLVKPKKVFCPSCGQQVSAKSGSCPSCYSDLSFSSPQKRSRKSKTGDDFSSDSSGLDEFFK